MTDSKQVPYSISALTWCEGFCGFTQLAPIAKDPSDAPQVILPTTAIRHVSDCRLQPWYACRAQKCKGAVVSKPPPRITHDILASAESTPSPPSAMPLVKRTTRKVVDEWVEDYVVERSTNGDLSFATLLFLIWTPLIVFWGFINPPLTDRNDTSCVWGRPGAMRDDPIACWIMGGLERSGSLYFAIAYLLLILGITAGTRLLRSDALQAKRVLLSVQIFLTAIVRYLCSYSGWTMLLDSPILVWNQTSQKKMHLVYVTGSESSV